MESQEFYQKVREYFHDKKPGIDMRSIGATDNLWDSGLVDSFSVAELVMFIESITNTEIQIQASTLRSFHTMERMYKSFIAPAHNKPAAEVSQ